MKTDLSECLPQTAPASFSPTVFHEPWWLHLASGGTYREVTAELGGQLAGRLPFILRRQIGGLSIVHIPELTHYLGPAIAPAFDRPGAVKSSTNIQICGQLLKQLPKAAHIWFRLHPATPNTLAFERAGFSSSVQWSVEVAPASTEDLWQQMRDKTRNAIRRAGDVLQVKTPEDAELFLNFYNDCLHETGRKNSYDEERLKRLIPEAQRRHCGRVLAAISPDGTPQAAIFTVWDSHREYYFMSARRPKAHSGAVNLLLWHALQEAALNGRVFDMDGIHVVGDQLPNLLLLSGFGGRIVPRYCVTRSSAALSVVQTVSRALRR